MIALLTLSIALQTAAQIAPPSSSPPVVCAVDVVFPSAPAGSSIPAETYLYYIDTAADGRSQGDEAVFDPHVVADDVKRLWDTGFIDDVSVDVSDASCHNRVGKRVVFRIHERSRIKEIEFVGSKTLGRTEIDRKLATSKVEIPLDSMIDAARIKRVEDVVRDMLQEKGHPAASVTHRVEVAAETGFARLTFVLEEGPRINIRRVMLTGVSPENKHAVEHAMKTKRNVRFDDGRLEADAERILDYYHDNGYAFATVGSPIVTAVDEISSPTTRWVDVQLPIVEGRRYRVANVAFDGNHAATADELRQYFGMTPGSYYDASKVRRGLEKAREWYGSRGYYEFAGYPDVERRDSDSNAVDVTIRLSEGDEYLIHRIVLNGNTSTQGEIVRRELPIVEGQALNTGTLKATVKRLNQLSFFQPISERDVKIDKTPGLPHFVDVTFDVKEQRRDNVNFSGGVSQAEGLYGNMSYVTPNLFGRGQTLTVAAQQGSRGNLYEATFAEPHVFGGAFSGSLSVYGGRTAYDTTTIPNAYSDTRSGVRLSVGKVVSPFTRVTFGYAYEIDSLGIVHSLLNGGFGGPGTPALTTSDLGRHVDGRLMAGVIHNTIDDALMPHDGVRLSAGIQLANRALGGDFDYVKPEAEAVWYHSAGGRTGVGVRAQAGAVKTYGTTTDVPYSLRYELGGENQIRGVDLRTVGPLDSNGHVLGGTSFTLFNAEYHVDLTRSVRLIAFGDAGQAFDAAHPLAFGELRTSTGIELRVVLPFIHVPLRFIYYWNPSRDSFQPSQGFRFSVGTEF